jgi:hypothetical protein
MPNQYPTLSPTIAAKDSKGISIQMLKSPSDARMPAVNSNDAPGRKNPNGTPLSRNITDVNPTYPSDFTAAMRGMWGMAAV